MEWYTSWQMAELHFTFPYANSNLIIIFGNLFRLNVWLMRCLRLRIKTKQKGSAELQRRGEENMLTTFISKLSGNRQTTTKTYSCGLIALFTMWAALLTCPGWHVVSCLGIASHSWSSDPTCELGEAQNQQHADVHLASGLTVALAWRSANNSIHSCQ